MIATLTPTGQTVPFSEIRIGKPFFHRDRFWVRDGRTSGTDIGDDRQSYGSCTFFVTENMLGDNPDERLGWIAVEKVAVSYG